MGKTIRREPTTRKVTKTPKVRDKSWRTVTPVDDDDGVPDGVCCYCMCSPCEGLCNGCHTSGHYWGQLT